LPDVARLPDVTRQPARVVYREPATMRNAIVEEAECYEDLNVSTATTTTSGYRVVGDKTLTNKQRLLDCLQE
jgi:hypothetical protein